MALTLHAEPNFNNHYLVFGHGLRLINKTNTKQINTNFQLGQNYRVITLHKPGEIIYGNLVKIITNQIEKKSTALNDLFLIKCPIARSSVKNLLENSFIRDYFIDIYYSQPDKLSSALTDIFYETTESLDIKSINDLNKYLDLVDYSELKSELNFEIRTYRPGDLCPKLLFDFKIQKSLGSLKGGIYNVNKFSGFNYDMYDELEVLESLNSNTNSVSNKINSDINFNINKQYVFDESDTITDQYESFFKQIKQNIPSGLLIVLSCGTYSSKPTQLIRKESLDRQNAPYRKYFIKYN